MNLNLPRRADHPRTVTVTTTVTSNAVIDTFDVGELTYRQPYYQIGMHLSRVASGIQEVALAPKQIIVCYFRLSDEVPYEEGTRLLYNEVKLKRRLISEYIRQLFDWSVTHDTWIDQTPEELPATLPVDIATTFKERLRWPIAKPASR